MKPAMDGGAPEADGAAGGREYDYIDAIADGILTGSLTQREAETLNEAGHQGLRNLITSLEGSGAADRWAEALGGGVQRGVPGAPGGVLPEPLGFDPSREDGQYSGHRIGSGSESIAFADPETGKAVKFRQVAGSARNALLDMLCAIVRHNALFPADAYTVDGLASSGSGSGGKLFLKISQPLVRPLRDEDGYTAKPTEGQITSALMKIRQDWVFHGTLDESATGAEGDSDRVGADRFMAVCPDYVVTDFKPGENTFIDEKTGGVRFIDPRILRNSPTAGIAPEAVWQA